MVDENASYSSPARIRKRGLEEKVEALVIEPQLQKGLFEYHM